MEMTHEQKAKKLFEKYVSEKGYSPSDIGVKDMIAFAAFCLEKQGDAFTELRDLLESLADIQNGPPLERYAKEWRELIDKVYTKLKETE